MLMSAVCGVVRSHNPNDDPDQKHEELENVIPIAGQYTHGSGATQDAEWTRLKITDSDEDGLRLQIGGGKYGTRKQKAVIDFICDPNATGNNDKIEDDKDKRADDDDEKKTKNSTSDLVFKSYGPVEEKGAIIDVLHLDWNTKYACEDYSEGKPSPSQSWGFFTWFILVYVFRRNN